MLSAPGVPLPDSAGKYLLIDASGQPIAFAHASPRMVDEKHIAFNPAVELSYLAEKEQQDLLKTMQSEDCTPSLAQAQRMKKLSQDGKLSEDVIFSILTEEKPNQKEKFNIQRERIDRFFPKNFTEKQKEDLIVQLLEGWYKKRQREQER